MFDESLSPNVARALRLVGYLTTLVEEIVEFHGITSVKDQMLIPWMGRHNAVWVHADDNAKRAHKKLLLAHEVRTLWVYRPGGKLSGKEQLRAISYVLPKFMGFLTDRPRKRHYEVRPHGAPNDSRVRIKAIDL